MGRIHDEQWLNDNFASCPRPESDDKKPVNIVIDTDIGSDADDSWALALAIASPEIHLRAVTTCGYNPGLRAKIAKTLLLLAGQGQVPVYSGSGSPMKKSHKQSPWARLWGGYPRFFTEDWLHQTLRKEMNRLAQGKICGKKELHYTRQESAVEALIDLFHKEENMELVCLGPLTNIAKAIKNNPSFIRKVKRITLMGGYLGQLDGFPKIRCGRKMMTPEQDYNLQIDPVATMIVLNSDIPIRLIPADVTLQSWLTPLDLKRFMQLNSPILRPLIKQSKIWSKIQALLLSSNAKENAGFLHDPLTLAASFNTSFFTFETIAIEPFWDKGMVRFRNSGKGRKFSCATQIHPHGFHEFFMNRLLRFSIHHLACTTGINLFKPQRNETKKYQEGGMAKCMVPV